MAAERRQRSRIWLMCDYFADPIWWDPSGTGASLDEIPISAATRSALKEWADSYDALADHDFEWPSERAEEEFRQRGRALWHTVQDELGDDWEVGYFDEEAEAIIWPNAS